MTDSIINNDAWLENGFDLTDDGGDKPLVVGDAWKQIRPLIDTPEKWKQYTNTLLYETEKDLREWMAKLYNNVEWRTSRLRRRYTCRMAFERIYGVEYDPKVHSKQIRALGKLMAHYSNKIQTDGYICGKRVHTKIFHLAAAGFRKRPYSIRLKIEMMLAEGKIPTNKDTEIPKLLQPNHARYERSEKNMQERRKLARERYYERKSAESSGGPVEEREGTR